MVYYQTTCAVHKDTVKKSVADNFQRRNNNDH